MTGNPWCLSDIFPEPLVKLVVNNQEHTFMVDTGARYSTINKPLPVSKNTVPVIGFSGVKEEWPLSKPVPCEWNGLTFQHEFLLSSRCPINLLARDILCTLNVSLLLTPDSVDIRFPNGKVCRCATPKNALWQLTQTLSGVPEEGMSDAEIWWGLVNNPEKTELFETKTAWSKWFDIMHAYREPEDPMHCTFNYTLDGNDDYDELWKGLVKHCEETEDFPVVETGYIYVATEGVAAEITLPEELQTIYALGETATPHITLKVAREGDAKNLGPMVKRGKESLDWTPTQCGKLQYSPKLDMYRIIQDSSVSLRPEKCFLPRSHGRENTDHPDTEKMLAD